MDCTAFQDNNRYKYLENKQERSILPGTSDVIEFLEFGKTESNGAKKVMVTTKSYSSVKDCNIVLTNSAILHNIHMFKGLAAADRMQGGEGLSGQHGYYYFDDRNVRDTFLDGDATRPVKRFRF